MRRARLVAAAVFLVQTGIVQTGLLLTGLASTAHAEDAATESARLHFQNGLRLYDASPPDYGGALVEFEASYRDKKAASTRLNIAICYRALRRYPEAIDALRDVLAFPPDQRTLGIERAAESAIRDMEALIGFVDIRVEGPPPGETTVVVDGEPRAFDPSAPLRVAAGIHTLSVRAPGFVESAPVRVAVAGAGRHHAIAFRLEGADLREGRIVFRGTWPALVDVDGIPTQTNAPAEIAAGVHRISMRLGARILWFDIMVDPGDERIVDAPSEREPALDVARGVDAVFPSRTWYLRGGLSVAGELLRFGASAGEPEAGTTRTLYGLGFAVAAGRNVSEHFAVELAGDIGTAWRDYALPAGEASAQIDTWAIAPALRFQTIGRARLTSALGIGVAGRTVGITRPVGTGNVRSESANGTTATLLVDVGADVDLGRIFLHGALFANGFRLAPIRGPNGVRPFEGELSLRTGARIEVGFDF